MSSRMPRRSSRKPCVVVKSPYFSDSLPPKRRKPSSPKQTVIPHPATAKSRFFPRPPIDIDSYLKDPRFVCFYEDFVAAMTALYHAKPILIQDHVSADVWKVLVAVTLLNKTAGRLSVPIFFEILNTWPTPTSLAGASHTELFAMIKDLGLGATRAHRLVSISQTFLSQPPTPSTTYKSRGKTTSLSTSPTGELVLIEVDYPPTPISHIPGCGPYALDSYRIFCAGDEWKNVRPTDKELIRYLEWRWAVDKYRQWDPVHGPGAPIDLPYVHRLVESLANNPPIKSS
ncbi:DNA glycosylase [Epithele typhae]|uniref:DNA glycosylase n=1 Tax=Epithele typhae TaxID=378194 RepID=UPI002007F655|nr:DNA glycosylase [Epithele typhae]KAH9917696.1 DNA glycosylase [Epithele typhae]